VSPFGYLVLAYALIWAALALYVFLLNRRIRRVHGELEELRRRLGRSE
jgi:CcmD family protein